MKSKIIIIGSGAREIAILHKLKEDLTHLNLDKKLICFTNQDNADVEKYVIRSIKYDIPNYFKSINKSKSMCLEYIKQNQKDIEFVIVGPENPLKDGVVDLLKQYNISCIGPYASYALLESSKSFCRTFINKCNLDRHSPNFLKIRSIDNVLDLEDCNNTHSAKEKTKTYLNNVLRKKFNKIVIKKDGLYGGKGVFVESDNLNSNNDKTNENTIEDILCNTLIDSYVNSTDIVIEEKLFGEEFSIMTLTDGNGHFYHFPPIQDYKRLKENDLGPNTGGMGCLVMENGTLPFLNQNDIDKCQKINETIINNLNMDGKQNKLSHGYKGVLYGSFMKLNDNQIIYDEEPNDTNTENISVDTESLTENIKIIEYNCRFGDPESIIALSLLESNLYTVFQQIINGNLDSNLQVSKKAALCVYLVPQEYPYVSSSIGHNDYDIYIKDTFPKDIALFMSNTKKNNNHTYSQKSRTLCLFTKKDTFYQCYQHIYAHIDKISGHLKYRRDIGDKYLSRYQKVGVSIETATHSLQKIKKHVLNTYNKNVISDFGSFGGEYKLDNHVLVASIDGVGSKSILSNKIYGIDGYKMLGQDIVGHSINDILVQGAYPLFFLDYYGTASLDSKELENFIAGLSETCVKYGNIPILGGETAEMPLVYKPNQSDLIGCIIGIKDKNYFYRPIEKGDIIISIDSVGPHTNGFTLINEIYQKFDDNPIKTQLQKEKYEHFAKILLEPHKCYLKEVQEFIQKYTYNKLKGMCHITGGGFYENMERVIPRDMNIKLYQDIKLPDWCLFLQEEGNISYQEMLKVFNGGIGYVLIVDKKIFENNLSKLDLSFNYNIMGEIS
jgi:phosphoribosylamine--glycine ligase / phosphoribosylformylglycinamidine cyclo-ligase